MIDGIIAMETDLLNEVLFNAIDVKKALLNYFRKIQKSHRI